MINDRYLKILFQSIPLNAAVSAFSCIIAITVALNNDVSVDIPLSKDPALNFNLILSKVSSLGRYVFGSEISYNKAPPRLPGLGC
jgi:hypothetical protein